MAKLLAIDLDPREIRLVLANRQGSSLTLEEVRSIPVKEVASRDPNEAIAAAMRELLSEGQYRSMEVLATVPRNDVELRLLNLPPIPLVELPDVVRLQAMREFSELDEDWPLDFLPVYSSDEQITVLAASLRPKRLTFYRQTLESGDLRPQGLVLRATAAAYLARTGSDSSARTGEGDQRVELVVEDLGETLEIMVLRDSVPVLIRTVPAPHLQGEIRIDHMAQEVRRTLLAARNQLHGDDAQSIVLFGATSGTYDVQALAIGLQSRAKLPVRIVNPFEQLAWDEKKASRSRDQAPPGHFAAAIGLLAGHVKANPAAIDLLHPRRAEPPKSYKREITIGLATAASLFLIIGGWVYWNLSTLDGQIADLQTLLQERKDATDAATERIAKVESVVNWEAAGVNWLDQLRDISQRIPPAEKARFQKMQMRLTPDLEGLITIEGVVDQQATIGAINQSLQDESRKVHGEMSEVTNREEGYPWHFKQSVTLATKAKKVEAPQRSLRGRRRATSAGDASS